MYENKRQNKWIRFVPDRQTLNEKGEHKINPLNVFATLAIWEIEMTKKEVWHVSTQTLPFFYGGAFHDFIYISSHERHKNTRFPHTKCVGKCPQKYAIGIPNFYGKIEQKSSRNPGKETRLNLVIQLPQIITNFHHLDIIWNYMCYIRRHNWNRRAPE